MPRIRLKYLAPLCDITGKWQEVVDVPEGTRLSGLLAVRAAAYDAAYQKLFFDSSGAFKPMFIVLRNDEPMKDFDTPVSDGDRYTFVPPLAGG